MAYAEYKLSHLQTLLFSLAVDGRLAIAFSGGLDSRFLAHTTGKMDLNPLLLHADGPHIARGESAFARQWATAREMDLRCLRADPLTVPEVAANERTRCYHCKKALFTLLKREAGELPLCDGTQASDADAYRPGVAALRELGIHSPLADAGLTKPEIRQLAEQSGMDFPDQRARPCLLTRFNYRLSPDAETLRAIDGAEEALEKELSAWQGNNPGAALPDFRLRHVRSGVLELHLTPIFPSGADASRIPDALRKSLEATVREATGVPLAAMRVMPNLSDFFDMEQPV
jgi:uncharacterized protein